MGIFSLATSLCLKIFRSLYKRNLEVDFFLFLGLPTGRICEKYMISSERYVIFFISSIRVSFGINEKSTPKTNFYNSKVDTSVGALVLGAFPKTRPPRATLHATPSLLSANAGLMVYIVSNYIYPLQTTLSSRKTCSPDLSG